VELESPALVLTPFVELALESLLAFAAVVLLV